VTVKAGLVALRMLIRQNETLSPVLMQNLFHKSCDPLLKINKRADPVMGLKTSRQKAKDQEEIGMVSLMALS